MADAWGGSWGAAWGVSWGTGAVVVPRETFVGGSKSRQKRLFPSDIYPSDGIQIPEKIEQAHEGRVTYDEELAFVSAQLEVLQTQKADVLRQIARANRQTAEVGKRLALLVKLKASRDRIEAEIQRLKRREQKRREVLASLVKVVLEQDEEDFVIALAIEEFFN